MVETVGRPPGVEPAARAGPADQREPGGRSCVAFSGVLIDLWGTLAAPFPKREHTAALAACFERLGIAVPASRGAWLEGGGRRALGTDGCMAEHFGWIAQRMGVTVTTPRLAAAEEVYLQFILERLVPLDGALEGLVALERAGLPLAVVSNCGPDVPQVWNRTALARFFAVRAFSCELGAAKPDPAIYAHALSALRLDPRRTLYVGDGSDGELAGAARLGMHPVLMRVDLSNTYDPDRPDVAQWRGDGVSNPREVPALLGLRTEGMWRGSAAICVDAGRVLLVHGGDPGDDKRWGLPGGALAEGMPQESFEACCRREVLEETGCAVTVGRLVRVKTHSPLLPSAFQCRIFEVRLLGGVPQPQDPDGDVDAAAWFTRDELARLDFHFPEDRALILEHLRSL